MSLRDAIRRYKAQKKARSFPYYSYHRENRCIFIHVPKVAGTSVLDALGKKRGGRQHLPWYVYYYANPAYFNTAFKFAFVRNPWDRTLSAYTYLKNGGNQKGDVSLSKKVQEYKSFDSFLVDGLGRGLFRNNIHFLTQSEFVLNEEGDVVVDFLGRYENIEEDFRAVAEKLYIDSKLPEKNISENPTDYRQAYQSREAIDVVEQIYRQDILVFDYSF